jgi:hypothetical protein
LIRLLAIQTGLLSRAGSRRERGGKPWRRCCGPRRRPLGRGTGDRKAVLPHLRPPRLGLAWRVGPETSLGHCGNGNQPDAPARRAPAGRPNAGPGDGPCRPWPLARSSPPGERGGPAARSAPGRLRFDLATRWREPECAWSGSRPSTPLGKPAVRGVGRPAPPQVRWPLGSGKRPERARQGVLQNSSPLG